jgi:hypothetical protein
MNKGTMKAARFIIGIALLAAQVSFAQLKVGDNTQLKAGGLATFGYAGDYGNNFPSSHGLDFGLNGELNGFYYNPNFLSFSATPYINQSRNDSSFQSLTGASGINGTANFFTGSNYPGTISYRYDTNSTGTFGLLGQPDFTTHGRGQGLSIGWSALVPDLPTLSVGYSQGSGSGTIFGTDEKTSSNNRTFNLHSTYSIEGFRLNGFYDHINYNSRYPQFLTGLPDSVSESSGHDYGFGATHALPWNGTFYTNFTRTNFTSDFFTQNSSRSNFADNIENAGANFHPLQKLSLFVSESYVSNLSGYFNQSLTDTGVVPVNFGSGSHSTTVGGGATYQFTNYLYGQAQATHYDQYYFGQGFTGTYVSGSVGLSKRLLNLFSFSATVIDSNNVQGDNALGFVGNVNYFHRFGRWDTSGNFSYAQNVQTILISYTTSSYSYGFNVHRRFTRRTQWTAAFAGGHSGLTQTPGNSNHTESYTTAFGTRWFSLTGNYGESTGISVLTANGLQPAPITPGLFEGILFSGRTYGGGISSTPLRRLVISATFNRAISDTTGSLLLSRNNTEIFNTQLQYHLRRIGFQAGYTKFIQGVSATGLPAANANAFFVGISRWFDLF